MAVAAPSVPLASCIEAAAAAAAVNDYLSPATGSKGNAEKTLRLTNYPDYLLVFLKRFYISDRWIPKKLKCSVEVWEGQAFSLGLMIGVCSIFWATLRPIQGAEVEIPPCS